MVRNIVVLGGNSHPQLTETICNHLGVPPAKILLGKHKPEFTPGADMGDMVIIVNAEKIIVTGNKGQDKLYRRHSGRPGGMKVESFAELQVRLARRASARLPPAPGPE